MERTRAWRRHQLRRIKRKAFRKFWEENWYRGLDRAQTLAWARRSANHLTACSCAGCGNPRRHFNYKTMAEKKAEISFREQVEEYERSSEGSESKRTPFKHAISSSFRSV